MTADSTSYANDSDGNMTTLGSQKLMWDAENRLAGFCSEWAKCWANTREIYVFFSQSSTA